MNGLGVPRLLQTPWARSPAFVQLDDRAKEWGEEPPCIWLAERPRLRKSRRPGRWGERTWSPRTKTGPCGLQVRPPDLGWDSEAKHKGSEGHPEGCGHSMQARPAASS